MMRLLQTPPSRRRFSSFGAPALWGALLLLAGCARCGQQVEGPTPYARCSAGDPPVLDAVKAGELRLRTDARTLHIEGAELPLDIAAFAGPGPGEAPAAARLRSIAESGAALALVLGDVGDRAAVRKRLITGLAALPFPSLVLSGARDTASAVESTAQGVDGRERVVDITTLHDIRIANNTFVPVAGAPVGRYARSDEACGFGLADLKQLAQALGPTPEGERRWLLSWHAPGGGRALGVARTEQGVDVGDPDLAELARRLGAAGGLFAWPHVQAGRARAGGGRRPATPGEPAADLRLVVPRISGPAQERSDGSRLTPGFALLRLSKQGLAVRAAAR